MTVGNPDTTGNTENTGSRTDEVYRRLRQEIVRGDLLPREALSEVAIADRLAVSRTPVRESLHRLASEGLIVSQRRRWIVYAHSKTEISDIYEVRAALESYAARLAAVRATDEELRNIIVLRSDQAQTDSVTGGEPRVDFNTHLHDSIVGLAHNPALLRQIRANRLYFFNRTVAGLYTAEDLVQSAAQHDELIDAVCRRDRDHAERVARQHIEYALDLIMHRLPGADQ